MATSTQTGVAGKATFTIPENSGMIEVTVGGVSVPFSQSQNDTLVTLVNAPAAGASIVFTFKQLPSDTLGLPLDEDGNLVANVRLRRNTLSELVALTLGIGELAVSSDYRAFVVGNATGNPQVSGGMGAIKRAVAWSFESTVTCTSGAAAEVLQLDGSYTGVDTHDISTANFTVAGVPAPTNTRPMLYEVQAEVSFSANATGTRTVALQEKIGAGAWTTVKSRTVAAAASGATDVNIPTYFKTTASSTSEHLYRLLVSSASATVDANMTYLSVASTPMPAAHAA